MNKYILTTAIFVLLSFTARGQAKTEISNTSKAGIMKALYHNYDIKSKTSKWFCTDGALLKTFSSPTPTQFAAKILYADSLVDGSSKKLYVLLSLKPFADETCHACAPVLKFLAFNKTTSVWVLEHQNLTDQIGSYGEAPQFTTKKTAKGIAFVFDAGFTNMGETTWSIVVYANYNGLLKQVLLIPESSYSNDGNCDEKVANSCYSYDGKIRFLETGKEFNDIVLTKKGTDKPKNKVTKIDSAITYRFVNGGYVRSK